MALDQATRIPNSAATKDAPAPGSDQAALAASLAATQNSILVTERGLGYATFDGLWRLANMIHRSGLFPKGLPNPEAICICIVRGKALGLDPFQAMDSIGVINGKPVLYGDAPLAVCRQHPAWDESGFEEKITGTGDNMVATCSTLRKGAKAPRVETFSVMDAKQAKLWGKEGPWTFYPKRMLMFRARGYNVRDNFGDALKGVGIGELLDDVVERTEQAQQQRSSAAASLEKLNGTNDLAAGEIPLSSATQPPPPFVPANLELVKRIKAEVARTGGDPATELARVLAPYDKRNVTDLSQQEAEELYRVLKDEPQST